jgi:hypothetical protein
MIEKEHGRENNRKAAGRTEGNGGLFDERGELYFIFSIHPYRIFRRRWKRGKSGTV